jgi:hypothetical protein
MSEVATVSQSHITEREQEIAHYRAKKPLTSNMEVKGFFLFAPSQAVTFRNVRYEHAQVWVAAHDLFCLNRKPVVKHISWIPLCLHALEAWIVGLIIDRIPRNTGRVPRGIREIDIWVVDQRPVVCLSRERRTARLGEEITVKRACEWLLDDLLTSLCSAASALLRTATRLRSSASASS